MAFELKEPEAEMTWKQGITIRNLGGGDVRNQKLNRQQASDLIGSLMSSKGIESLGGVGKGKSLKDVRAMEFQTLYDKALEAGVAAGKGSTPTPMNVIQHVNQLDDSSPVEKAWHVPDGVCGFAWIIIKPGNSSFANWLKKQDLARKDSYYGGVCIYISEYGQSMERKQAHAHAMANVFTEAGINAQSMSRMD